MGLSQAADRSQVTVGISGAVAVTDVSRSLAARTLVEVAPGRYKLRARTAATDGGPSEPCDAGHVPYTGTVVLPYGGLEEFRLTVVHDGEPVATWGSGPA